MTDTPTYKVFCAKHGAEFFNDWDAAITRFQEWTAQRLIPSMFISTWHWMPMSGPDPNAANRATPAPQYPDTHPGKAAADLNVHFSTKETP